MPKGFSSNKRTGCAFGNKNSVPKSKVLTQISPIQNARTQWLLDPQSLLVIKIVFLCAKQIGYDTNRLFDKLRIGITEY